MTRSTASDVSAGVLLLALVGCSADVPLEFADWQFTVPAGAPVIEYPAAPAPGVDPGTVRMVEDLVIGGDPSNPDALLYRPRDVAVAGDGTIFIADGGTHQIKVFGPDGSFRRALGAEGQGPGEFTGLNYVTIAGERLVAYDGRNRRFSIWTLAGEHVADHKPEVSRSLSSLAGRADGTLVWRHTEFDPERGWSRHLTHSTLAGEELGTWLDRPGSSPREISFDDPVAVLQTVLEVLEEPRFLVAAGGQDATYFSPGAAYQVLALSPDGTPRWALRRAGSAPTIAPSERGSLIATFTEGFAQYAEQNFEITADEITWPEHIPAIFELRVDGSGRLFVFAAPAAPRIAAPALQPVPADSWPVHVYSAEGEFITAGRVPIPWDHAQGEHVYEIRTETDADPVVVRYRLTAEER